MYHDSHYILKILKLDEDMQSGKFRIQKDALDAVNLGTSLFVKLLTKTCEMVQNGSSSSLPARKNQLDIGHLSKAVEKYDVLEFLKDLVSEMAIEAKGLDQASKDLVSLKRKENDVSLGDSEIREENFVDAAPSPKRTRASENKQASITSFLQRS